MIAIDAVRLAIVEILRPSAQVAKLEAAEAATFPTIAAHRVYDSRSIQLQDLDPNAAMTPTVAVYTDRGRWTRNGEGASYDDAVVTTAIDIVSELAVRAADEDGDFADAAPSDPVARLRLGALVSQIVFALTASDDGNRLRRFAIIDAIESHSFDIPSLGLRYLRTSTRLDIRLMCDMRTEAGALPQPMRSFFDGLPAQSYARQSLAELEGAFDPQARAPLSGIVMAETDVTADPYASTGSTDD